MAALSITTKNKIESYEKDIWSLQTMLLIYEHTSNLFGGYHDDMKNEIDCQIKHCKYCIENLKKSNQ